MTVSKIDALKARVEQLRTMPVPVKERWLEEQRFNESNRDEMVADAVDEWIGQVNQQNTNTVIISVGSGNAPKQQKPSIASQLKTAAVLNIDTMFRNEPNVVEQGVSIEFIPSIIAAKETPKAYQRLKQAITHWAHSGKNVIFMSHISPHAYHFFADIIHQNLDQLGLSFSYVGSYHEPHPVVVYSQAFLNNDSSSIDEKNRMIRELWGKAEQFTSVELAEWL